MAYRPLPIDIEKRLFEIFGLSDQEQVVLSLIRVHPIRLASIAHVARFPRTSVADILRRLKSRGLAIAIGAGHKNTRWRSNTAELFKEIREMRLPPMGAWIEHDKLDEYI